MSESDAHVVIVGAGHAGGSAAATLRQYEFAGAITLIGEEVVVPYQRPPLSKAWLKGEADADSLALRPASFYPDRGIDLRLNQKAVKLDRAAKTVHTDTGEQVHYDKLILATGARARPLPVPGADLSGVMYLRNSVDAEMLKASLERGKRLAVIGGGYIGLEAAASARALDAEAVVIEVMPRVLARVACEQLSTFIQDYHRARGVRFELNVGVIGFVGEEGRVTGVRLSDGRVIDCDAVLVGIGAVPNAELGQEAGLQCADGVAVDLAAQTSDPDIFAIGDVTRRPMPLYGRDVRLESVANALEQTKQAAAHIVGKPAPRPEVTWNWSDQYDLKLQIGGLAVDAESTLLRGDPATGSFAVFHLRGDVIRAVEAVNAAPEFMGGKQLIASQKPIAPERLADISVPMKEIAA
ncbi:MULTISPECIES: NAD(P)/FAD-dependent oxidoreductase [Mycolicibacterium]|uniref:FAD-dependent pyridine nucleotide-disulfide oxidoreductase n=1 Tax=Mycolicibacterium senegalense TaxID=1796 RepID=A0A378W4T8_9MYCO|nr:MULTISPECIES: FAD-dependent oxidoreductase [Mycolicibacterium]MCV7337531.1 FAD-dependent oxidoreductase [Mycolicibacterium senegalense]MDR7289028.1 3-phenylpropionate/trans-cinnamate dioxygenase ferredoxin reductase subunit [Mycolicibacterium senegalense]QZA25910.1 FAD-dependent oxidoreductase [Mycolicibacterium senegalense]CDP84723.1 FAD-dependent pyridine nucleotide-disulfide oxidoreductase [Mycolicibacterium farcinogenes]SUA27402.1 FAD-dependent pyridine nucleotide-disulfide oxidoreducta